MCGMVAGLRLDKFAPCCSSDSQFPNSKAIPKGKASFCDALMGLARLDTADPLAALL